MIDLVVGLDIDGIMVDVDKYIHEKGVALFGTVKNPAAYHIQDKWNLPESANEEFWSKYRLDYVKNVENLKFFDTFRWYFDDVSGPPPHYVITSRIENIPDYAERNIVREHTNNFIHDCFPYVKKIIYTTAGHKLEYCKKYGINLMVDDYIGNYKPLCEEGIKCITIAYPHNKDYDHPNLIRCKDLYHVMIIIARYRGGDHPWEELKAIYTCETPT